MRFSLLALALAPCYAPHDAGGGGGTPIDPATAARLGLTPRPPESPNASPSPVSPDAAPAPDSLPPVADAPAADADAGHAPDAGDVGGADAADAAADAPGTGERGGRGVDGGDACPFGCECGPVKPEEHEVSVDVLVLVTEDGVELPPIKMTVAAAYHVPGELRDFVSGLRFGARSALSTLLGSGRLFV